jgi:DNA repair protein RadD
MQLRPRQKVFVEKSVSALKAHGNTLSVAPTGGGKTVMLSGVACAEAWGGPGCIIQHRDELVGQNRKTFWLFNRNLPSDLFTAERKRWVKDGMTFAMIQTLARKDNLDTMPPLGFLGIDEAHHSASDSYLRVIDHALKLNPNMKLFGVTATPNRGDKKALKGVFTNCADQISIKELIDTGFLVRPRTFVIDIGVQDDLRRVKRVASDFDMSEVERIMDKEVLNDRIVEEWRKVAGDRRTIVFASTVAHAQHVAECFRSAGVAAAVVDGEMPSAERERTLAAFDRGDTQVVVNVAVLTEGYDNQPVSCIVLLRPSSYKSTMIQMIGRGLRKVDPERYPGIVKDDCVVIDFGTSVLLHGSIEQEVSLEGKGTKTCPECGAEVPDQCKECPICGVEFPQVVEEVFEAKKCKVCGTNNPVRVRCCVECGEPFGEGDEKQELGEFVLTEIDLLNLSPYRWEAMFDGLALIASAFDAWACVLAYAGRWFALGGAKGEGIKLLGDNNDRSLCLVSADDYLREHGDLDGAAKTKRWLSMPPSDAQLAHLGLSQMNSMGLTRYRAACSLTWVFNEKAIRRRLEDATANRRAA